MGKSTPSVLADYQDGGGGHSLFPGIVWLTLGARIKISPSLEGGCLSWQGQCSHSLLCCTYHNPLFTSLMPSQTLLPVVPSSHYPAPSMQMAGVAVLRSPCYQASQSNPLWSGQLTGMGRDHSVSDQVPCSPLKVREL